MARKRLADIGLPIGAAVGAAQDKLDPLVALVSLFAIDVFQKLRDLLDPVAPALIAICRKNGLECHDQSLAGLDQPDAG